MYFYNLTGCLSVYFCHFVVFFFFKTSAILFYKMLFGIFFEMF